MAEKGDPVRLRRAEEYRGKITNVVNADTYDVEFHGGGTGRFRGVDLLADEDKAWPPTGLETKVPQVDSK